MSPETLSASSDLLVTLFRDWGVPADVLRFCGRLHPMLVHFPIALLLMATVLEMLRLKGRERPARGAYACLAFATLFGLLAGTAGWLNAALEPHARSLADTLSNHRWLGVATVSCALLAFVCATLQRFGVAGASVPYRGLLLLSALLVVPTGHLGGALVFGDGYLFEVLRPASEEPATAEAAEASEEAGVAAAGVEPNDVPVEGLSIWRDEVRPLLEARCFECHGPDKKKGGLRLDRLAQALDPEVGVIAAGDVEGSYLYELVTLDADDPDVMPAEGEALTPEQVDAIRRWIEAGAPHDGAAGPSSAEQGAAATPTDEEASAPAPVVPATPAELDEAAVAAIAAVEAAGGSALPIAAESIDVEVSFARRGAEAGDDVLACLEGLEAALVSLRLDRTAVTDAAAARAATLPRLARLDLSRTVVGDAAVDALAAHPTLAVLNLYGTSVTDAGVARLADFPALERVFLWDSGATKEGVEALRAARPDLYVEFGDLADALTEAAPAADEPVASTPAPCCAEAAAAGGECEHACCVAAREAGEPVCVKCGGVVGK